MKTGTCCQREQDPLALLPQSRVAWNAGQWWAWLTKPGLTWCDDVQGAGGNLVSSLQVLMLPGNWLAGVPEWLCYCPGPRFHGDYMQRIESMVSKILLDISSIFLWSHLWHVEVPEPGTEPAPQQRPKPLSHNSDNTKSLTHWATRELLDLKV